MKKIDLRNRTNLYFTGDIHGEFRKLVWSLTQQWHLTDCVVVVCGDIGMGFYKRGYYSTEFQHLQEKLAANDITLVMFRGNHDYPSYFDCEEFSEFWYDGAYPNVFLVPDYTVLETKNGNVLCIGGAISIDRSQRTEYVSWWKDEKMVLPDELDYLDISKESIDIVATHCCPLVCGPRFNDAMGFEKVDKFIMSELHNERLDFNDLLEGIKKVAKIKYWFYGHFHGHFSDEIDGIRFTGLDMLRSSGADIYQVI